MRLSQSVALVLVAASAFGAQFQAQPPPAQCGVTQSASLPQDSAYWFRLVLSEMPSPYLLNHYIITDEFYPSDPEKITSDRVPVVAAKFESVSFALLEEIAQAIREDLKAWHDELRAWYKVAYYMDDTKKFYSQRKTTYDKREALSDEVQKFCVILDYLYEVPERPGNPWVFQNGTVSFDSKRVPNPIQGSFRRDPYYYLDPLDHLREINRSHQRRSFGMVDQGLLPKPHSIGLTSPRTDQGYNRAPRGGLDSGLDLVMGILFGLGKGKIISKARPDHEDAGA